MSELATRAAIEAVWRIESARLIGGLVRMVRDVGLAEDLAQEALVAALERWPGTGIPDNPGAWLMATAKNRAVDQLRQEADARPQPRGDRLATPSPGRRPGPTSRPRSTRTSATTSSASSSSPAIRCCRPRRGWRSPSGSSEGSPPRRSPGPSSSPSRPSRSASCGRSGRSPRRRCRSRSPAATSSRPGSPRCSRSSTSSSTRDTPPPRGDDWMRSELCDDALRLGRILAGLVPGEAEVHGLVALMELQASRLRARVGPDGEPILPPRPGPRLAGTSSSSVAGSPRWTRAEALARPLGPYTLQAAIAACHARARSADETDWKRIVALYDALVELTPSPVVELNRAVAVSMAFGPAAGARARRCAGRRAPARAGTTSCPACAATCWRSSAAPTRRGSEFERAAALTQNARERALLLGRARACGRRTGGAGPLA